jgi:sugar (pentulose or hexulose) kinase
MHDMKNDLENGKTYLGIELGSTRIKAVLIDSAHQVIATSSHQWENKLENGIWTYALDDVWKGVQDCYAKLAEHINEQYGVTLRQFGAIGLSGMMHGYLAFHQDELLVPFRTWRNTITAEASRQLTQLFGFNIPQRWTIAHLYQAVLNNEPHVKNITRLATLPGYVHGCLTGENVSGIGDASAMFPINDQTRQYDKRMIQQFNAKVKDRAFPWNVEDLLPEVVRAGEEAGSLTEKGARLLDPTGRLKPGIPLCPPEGDAGTGMVATHAVQPRSGNVSAGTSVFAMVVLEKPLSKVYPEIDLVTTPWGDAVAMVHCNNFLGDIDAWVKLLGEAATLMGAQVDTATLYSRLYDQALSGDVSCNGMLSFNYISGEHITGFERGSPLFMRKPDADFTLSNFMRTHLYSSCASLNIGMKLLLEKEKVALDHITGHGGFFKDAYTGQRIMSAALNRPVTVMETAGEGGPWGMAVLAAFSANNRGRSLDQYLSQCVFKETTFTTVEPDPEEVKGFQQFVSQYQASLPVERAAVENFLNGSKPEES